MGLNGADGVHVPQPRAAEPVEAITVSVLANGQINVKGNVGDPLRILGILEMGKAAILKRGAAEPSPIVPGRFGG